MERPTQGILVIAVNEDDTFEECPQEIAPLMPAAQAEKAALAPRPCGSHRGGMVYDPARTIDRPGWISSCRM
jgi:hypothetical protein